MVIKTVTEAGVTRKSRAPFDSIEINDQVNGHQGTVLDDIADQNAKITTNKINSTAGILGRKVEKTFSTAFRN